MTQNVLKLLYKDKAHNFWDAALKVLVFAHLSFSGMKLYKPEHWSLTNMRVLVVKDFVSPTVTDTAANVWMIFGTNNSSPTTGHLIGSDMAQFNSLKL